MPRNGAGVYSLPSGNPVTTGSVISSTTTNNTFSDIATALSGSLTADGQTSWAGNQNAGNNRLTALAAAAALTDATNANDVQTGTLLSLTGVAGTNTITGNVPVLAAYTSGSVFRLVSANANTGAATLNINGLGAKNITRDGTTALIAGDIPSGKAVEVMYDGTQFQLLSQPSTGRLIGVQFFTAAGTSTYTPTVGTRSVVVELVGGGGAGGGASATGVGQIAAGSGGGAGGYAKSRLTSSFSGVTVTVGAGGAGSPGGVGGNGGTTSFGAIVSATGGNGGGLGTVVTAGTVSFVAGGAGGVGSSGVVNTAGAPGDYSLYASAATLSGKGGASVFGGGASSVIGTSGGTSAVGYGAGGSGGSLAANSSAAGGGNGAVGLVIVYEYA